MEERCKHNITLRRVIEEEIAELGEKPLRDPPSRNDPLVNKLEYKDTQKKKKKKNPPSLIYPKYLSPLSSSYQ